MKRLVWLIGLPLLVLLVVLVTGGLSHQAEGVKMVTFSHGVASGDVRPHSAVLWTRTDEQPALLWAEVALDPSFDSVVVRRIVLAKEDNDFTVKRLVAPLEAGQTYYYRFRHWSSVSDTGTFRTAPLRHEPADLTFAWSGDSDGTKIDGVPQHGNFEVLDRAREDDPDFFIYLGDIIIGDSPHGPDAETLDDFRAKYKENRGYDALMDLMASTSTWAQWDDHEVTNDFAGPTVDPALLAAGLQAFKEYMPILEIPFLPDILYRSFRWGQDAEFFILDERMFRSDQVVEACTWYPGILDIVDQAPTLPAYFRGLMGLPPEPPPGCLDALYDPSRTMLGTVQLALLKLALLNSDATFKFIVNEVPMIELFLIPYDRWEGYRAERDELLRFIRDNDIKNVIFLTGDLHGNIIADAEVGKFYEPGPVAKEIIVGPIARFTIYEELLEIFEGDVAAVEAAIGLLVGLADPDCYALNTPGYGLVELDSATKTVTVTLKDDAGNVLQDGACQIEIPAEE
jgi:alkaline phosphatase D